jgi:hypothetical protein
MSKIFETVKERITIAIKARDQPRKDIYRLLKGKMDLLPKLDDETATKLVRTMLKDAKEYPEAFTPLDVVEMKSLVPELFDIDQTLAALDEAARESIRAAKADNQALGVAMKNLKGQPVDSEIVRYVVLKLRENV